MDDQTTQQRDKVRELVTGMTFAMLTTIAEDGKLQSRPMTLQRVDDDFRLLFIAQRGDPVVQDSDNKEVNLAFSKGADFVSISGLGEIIEDLELKKELWTPANDAFAEGGPENPDNVVIAVLPVSGAYWDSPAGPMTLLSMAKALITRTKPEAGDHGAVEL